MTSRDLDLQRASASPPLSGNPLAKRSKALSGRHQDLKFTLHRKLLDKINLDALATIETETLLNTQPRGVELDYRVIAVNKAGTGQPSATVSVVL